MIIRSEKGCYAMRKNVLCISKFIIGGSLYYFLESVTRGYSHWTMFILGGACFLACGFVNNLSSQKTATWEKMVWCMIIITSLELIAGIIVNRYLGWEIWNYSRMPLQVMDQICVPFMLLWYVLGYPILKINKVCDLIILRHTPSHVE